MKTYASPDMLAAGGGAVTGSVSTISANVNVTTQVAVVDVAVFVNLAVSTNVWIDNGFPED